MQRQKGLLFAWKTRQPSEKFRFWDGSYGLQWGTSLTTDLIETVKITMVRKKHTLLCCFKIKIALNHTQSSIFETYLHSRKVPRLSNGGSREKQRIDEGSKYSSNCCKTVVTVDYLTAKLKLRSLLNCEIQSLRLAVKIKGAVISTFSLFSWNSSVLR